MEEEKSNNYIRKLIPTPQFDEFFFELPESVQAKFDYVFTVITTEYNVPTKFIKHLKNTNLYEMRVSVSSNEFRTILFAADHPNFIEATQIILLNGFLKKGNKDYKKHIDKAIRILNDLNI